MPTTLARTGREIIEAHLKQRVRAIPLAVPKDAPTQLAFPSTGLVSYWSMDSNFQDQVGTNHLTNVNGVTRVAGKLGNAGDFESSSSQYLSHADPTPLGDEDFTYTCWFKLESTGQVGQLLAKDAATGRSYHLVHLGGIDNYLSLRINAIEVAVTSLVPIADTNWHFVTCWHDAVGNTFNMQLDNGAVNSTASAGIFPAITTTPFTIGARAYAGFPEYFDGLIDEVGLWRRVLTAGERSDLWNGGAGLPRPTAPPVFPSTGLVSYWSMDSNFQDQVGTNHLTNVNGVTSAAGKLGNAGNFVFASTQYLSHASNSDLQLGDRDWTIQLWAKLDAGAGNVTLLAKDGSSREYHIDKTGTDVRMYWVNGGVPIVQATLFTTGTWGLILAWYDATANTLNLQLNNGAVTAVSDGGSPPPVGTTDFRIGHSEAGGSAFWGQIDEVAIWHRVLTAQERSDLYNGGAGLPSSPLHPEDIVLTDDTRDLFAAYVVQVETGAMPFRVRVDPPTVFHPGYYYEHVSEDGEGLWIYAPTR